MHTHSRPDPTSTTGFSFPPEIRVRRPNEYAAVFAKQHKVGDAHLLLFAKKNDLGITRLGTSVSKKQGGSVTRHHLKRLLREAFRLIKHELPQGLDLVAIPRAPSHAELTDFQQSLIALARRLAKKAT